MSDFDQFLAEIGITHEAMDDAARAMTEPLPRLTGESYVLEPSPIHGVGVFAGIGIAQGADVALLKTGDDWTEAGRFMNHEREGNCLAYERGNSVRALALRRINAGDEMTVDYRQVRNVVSLMSGG